MAMNFIAPPSVAYLQYHHYRIARHGIARAPGAGRCAEPGSGGENGAEQSAQALGFVLMGDPVPRVSDDELRLPLGAAVVDHQVDLALPDPQLDQGDGAKLRLEPIPVRRIDDRLRYDGETRQFHPLLGIPERSDFAVSPSGSGTPCSRPGAA